MTPATHETATAFACSSDDEHKRAVEKHLRDDDRLPLGISSLVDDPSNATEGRSSRAPEDAGPAPGHGNRFGVIHFELGRLGRTAGLDRASFREAGRRNAVV